MIPDRFPRVEDLNFLFNGFEGSNEEKIWEKWLGNKRKRFYIEICGNAARREGACENSVGLSMYDGPMGTVEYMWVNIWCMLDWIIGFCYKSAEIHSLRIQLIN